MGMADFVKWLKNFIFTVVSVAIAYWVAGKPDGTLRWWMIVLGIVVACVTIGMVVERGWLWYRRRPPA